MGDHKLPCREFLFGLHDKQVIVWLLDAEIRDESDPQTDPGEIDEQMMYNTFNMGLGMIVAVDPADVDKTMEAIRAAGDTPYVVGRIEDGEKGVELC